jgi:hypothetical protein
MPSVTAVRGPGAIGRAAALVLLMTVAVACGPTQPTVTPPATGSAGPTSSNEPALSPTPGPSPAPGSSITPGPTPSPSTAGLPSPTPSSTPPPNPDPAAACSGSDRNRDFYAAVAQAVDWDVYCAVLPGGWYVDQGTYRLANGGRLEIAYKGPAGARLELREGAFCSEADGCVPAGTEVGEAAFGDRAGTLVELADGGWAVVVDRGERISWLAVGEGLAQAEFADLVAHLARVDA